MQYERKTLKNITKNQTDNQDKMTSPDIHICFHTIQDINMSAIKK